MFDLKVFIPSFNNQSRLEAAHLILWKQQGPQFIRKAKPGDADLLSEIQNTDPWIMNAGGRLTLTPLAFQVVRWLQVSNFHVN